MNQRIRVFLNGLQRLSDVEIQLYAHKKKYQQQWDEEFKSTKDHAMDNTDNVSTDEWGTLGIEYDDVEDFVTNMIDHGIIFYEGGAALVDRERGRFARRITTGQNLI